MSSLYYKSFTIVIYDIFIVLATVITIVNYDQTVIMIVNYELKTFIVQATALISLCIVLTSWEYIELMAKVENES